MRPQRILKLTILFLIFCLTGCGTLYSTSRLIKGPTEKELNAICEAKGGHDSSGPLYVDGYYLPDASKLFGFAQAIKKFGEGRFQFFEMDTRFVIKEGSWRKAELELLKGRGKYTRFYLAKRGDENCKMFEHHLTDSRRPAQYKARLRVDGIYPVNCVAAIKTDELKSKYTINTFAEPDKENPGIVWKRDQVVNTETGDVYASYNQFRFCLKGRVSKNECRGDWDDIYSCSPEIEGYDEGYQAIYYGTLKANPNPILKKQLEIIDIQIPLNVTPKKMVPELVQIRIGKKNIKRLIGDEVLDLYQSIEPEGYAWFGERREQWSENGEKFNSRQPQVAIINENNRKLLKIDIVIADPKLMKVYDYCCLRAVENEGVFFLAWGGMSELTEKANNFKILNYSWDGKLKDITIGHLPFTFIPNGVPRHHYAKLIVEDNHYYFSVLERSEHHISDGNFEPTKEFRFRVPRA